MSGPGLGPESELRLGLGLGLEFGGELWGWLAETGLTTKVGARVRLGQAAHLSGFQVSRLLILPPSASSQKCCSPALEFSQPPLSVSCHPSHLVIRTTWVGVEVEVRMEVSQ